MKRLLILTTLAALTSVSFGCCGLGSGGFGGCFGRRNECSPCGEAPCGAPACGCDSCGAGPMGAPVMSAPATITPGPAYTTGYLPKQ